MVVTYSTILFKSLSTFKRTTCNARAASNMQASLNAVWNQMKDASQRYAQETAMYPPKEPRLVAVSKTKPTEVIEDAYACGQRSFGENYVQELVEKAKKFKEKGGFDEIKWHFIGHLQRNKVNNLCSAPNLEMVETVDSVKLADALNRSWGNANNGRRLKVMVQVNTSEEQNKSGCSGVQSCLDLVTHIRNTCMNLEFVGLMTIGRIRTPASDEPNPDFEVLVSYREEICKVLGLLLNDVELSMGMSADFVAAVSMIFF